MSATGNTPVRVQLSRKKGWRMPPNTVKVCRPGPWGNPFPVTETRDHSVCVFAYRRVLNGATFICDDAEPGSQKRLRDYYVSHIHELRGKNLACWCPLDKPCHADVLLGLAND